jgi:diguanylate cyclase (GGDEF)-like protein
LKKAGAGGAQAKAARLRREVVALRAAIGLLHRIGNLVAGALELEPACYAVLTAVTAGVGLGLNRAMLFLADPQDRHLLYGVAAVGPADREEADGGFGARQRRGRAGEKTPMVGRGWTSMEADAHGLEAVYASGLRHRAHAGRLDRRVRQTALDGRGHTPVALAFKRGVTVIGEGEDDADGLFDRATSIAAPLRDLHGVSGVLYADNRFTGRRLDAVAEQVFAMVADHAGRAISNARRFEEVSGAARTDALTGLRHHGAFMTDLGHEVTLALAQRRALGLAMIDLDGFKQVNDRLGHQAGDALLAGLAARMRGVIRGGESLYRYGGDEFAALLPGADHAAAALVGARLHAAVSDQPFAFSQQRTLRVTCSVGVASLPEDSHSATGLVEAADKAMFHAKAGGRDRVGEAGDGGEATPAGS